jgi:hypothetical protein
MNELINSDMCELSLQSTAEWPHFSHYEEPKKGLSDRTAFT